jgi:hypothetical protein
MVGSLRALLRLDRPRGAGAFARRMGACGAAARTERIRRDARFAGDVPSRGGSHEGRGDIRPHLGRARQARDLRPGGTRRSTPGLGPIPDGSGRVDELRRSAGRDHRKWFCGGRRLAGRSCLRSEAEGHSVAAGAVGGDQDVLAGGADRRGSGGFGECSALPAVSAAGRPGAAPAGGRCCCSGRCRPRRRAVRRLRRRKCRGRTRRSGRARHSRHCALGVAGARDRNGFTSAVGTLRGRLLT